MAYFHADRLGSVVATTDAAGLAAATYAYSPYGESDAPLAGNPFRFTGRRLDFESGLYHYRARYYSPRLGQFLQTDPIGAQDDPNLYLYVGLDPVNAVDPMGEINWKKVGERLEQSGDIVEAAADAAASFADYLSVLGDENLTPVQKVGQFYDHIGFDPFAMKGPSAVIGEGMTRVEAYAERIGGEAMVADLDSDVSIEDQSRAFVQRAMDEGRQVVDIGPNPENPDARSAPYAAELEAVREYPGYRSHAAQAAVGLRTLGAPTRRRRN